MDLRIFLTGGMVFSGFFATMIGFAQVRKIHSLAYFLVLQVISRVVCVCIYILSFFQSIILFFLLFTAREGKMAGPSWICSIVWMARCRSNNGKLVWQTKTGSHSGMTLHALCSKVLSLFFFASLSSCTSLWKVTGNLELSYISREHNWSSGWSGSIEIWMGVVILCYVYHPCFRRDHSVFFPRTLPGLFVSPEKLIRERGWRDIKVSNSQVLNK